MSEDIVKVEKINEVYLRVYTDPCIRAELYEYFSFMVPGAHFMPKFRNKMWDGRLRLFDINRGTLYLGLYYKLIEFCKARDYELIVPDDFDNAEEFSVSEAKEFIETLNLPYEVRDYQLKLFVDFIRYGRGLGISPTASGKSLIIYLTARYYDDRTLIVVPTTHLVHQMASDFEEYGYTEEVSKIVDGAKKTNLKKFTISTWQSIYKQSPEWFSQFKVIEIDECHLATAQSLTGILTNAHHVPHRFGCTGTLDDSKTHKFVLEGLFGRIFQYTTTAELIESGTLSALKIKAILLKYSDETRQYTKEFSYKEELDFLVGSKARNKFIRNLAMSLEGNTLILFQLVDKHGKILYNDLKKAAKGKKVYFIHGGVDSEERDQIRKLLESTNDAIIVASYQTFSTGANTKNLHNLILASPSKGKIRVMQSIGRSLRKTQTKTLATLYDIGDDLSYKKKKNYTLDHFLTRINLYTKEKLNFKLYQVQLKEE